MNLKYYNAQESIRRTPKQAYRQDFGAIFDSSIDNAPNVFDDVQVEENYGKRDFIATKARVDSVINPSTGYKYGDDYKSFIFSPNDTGTFIGRMLKWKGNYWLCINANTYESCTNGCICRRCNNTLRWIDENGKKIYEPCVIDYNIMEAGDYQGRDTTIIGGFEKIWCQRNERTKKIRSNQRFLFGVPNNPVCYKIYANGIRNFLNSSPEDYDSPSVVEITIGGNYANKATDDFENLIADAYINRYSVVINQDNIKQLVGFKTQLTVDIKENNEIVVKPIIWKSSNPSVCSIDVEGNIECLALGSSIITAYLYDNPDIKYSIEVEVAETIEDEYFVMVNPENYSFDNSILQGDTVIYDCVLYKNGIAQEDQFTFEVSTNATNLNYSFDIIDGNRFRIKNKKRSSNLLTIICKSGDNIYNYTISLKGAW